MKTDKEELAWLAGAWDGEGSISIFPFIEKFHYKKGGIKKETKTPFRKLIATLTIVNTEVSFIEEVIRILDKNGISMHLSERKISRKNNKHSDCYQLSCRRMIEVKKFLELLSPYFISKKPQANLVLRFVNSRLKQFGNGNKWGHNTPYSEEEQSLEQQIRILNKKGPERILNDYMPNTEK